MRYVLLEKRVGETPLEAVETWREQHPLYTTTPLSYAGRLDPMASGKLLVLIGEECKKQNRYTSLDKEYEIEVLLDVASDTGDALGRTTFISTVSTPDKKEMNQVFEAERGTYEREYPIFSSKTVAGKPLFLYALSGTLDTISVPTHREHIYGINLLSTTQISTKELRERVEKHLAATPVANEPSKILGADFRITAVREHWDTVFTKARERSFTILRLRVVCGSGTYMRTLAPRIGVALGTKALALSIHRTKIGTYWHGLWLRTF